MSGCRHQTHLAPIVVSSAERPMKKSILSPSRVVDLWEHASFLYHNLEWQGAADAFAALEHEASDPAEKCAFAINKGLIEARLGDFDFAITSFATAILHDDDDPVACFLLGLVYAETGDLSKGEAYFERALENLERPHSHLNTVAFGVTEAAVRENIERLRNAQAARGNASICVSNILHTIPANIIFEAPSRTASRPSIHENPTTEDDLICGTPERRSGFEEEGGAQPTKRLTGHWLQPTTPMLKPGPSKAEAPFEMLVTDFHGSDGENTGYSGPITDNKTQKKLEPRDAQIRNASTQELARFLRHAGPSGATNVTLDRKYMQLLLQNHTNVLQAPSRSSMASATTQHSNALAGYHDDIGSLLDLYHTAQRSIRPVPRQGTSKRQDNPAPTGYPQMGGNGATGFVETTIDESQAAPSKNPVTRKPLPGLTDRGVDEGTYSSMSIPTCRLIATRLTSKGVLKLD